MKFKIFIAIILSIIAIFLWKTFSPKDIPLNFEECVAMGNPVMESYPRQCKHGEETFVEEVEDYSTGKENLIRVSNPVPNQEITSPFAASGEARGYWFFEASFPISILDGNGNEIVMGIAEAQGEWMTEDFVPFLSNIVFEKPETSNGTIVFHRDNPSGLPENDNSIEIPITFAD